MIAKISLAFAALALTVGAASAECAHKMRTSSLPPAEQQASPVDVAVLVPPVVPGGTDTALEDETAAPVAAPVAE